jgi:hypothetical protein
MNQITNPKTVRIHKNTFQKGKDRNIISKNMDEMKSKEHLRNIFR